MIQKVNLLEIKDEEFMLLWSRSDRMLLLLQNLAYRADPAGNALHDCKVSPDWLEHGCPREWCPLTNFPQLLLVLTADMVVRVRVTCPHNVRSNCHGEPGLEFSGFPLLSTLKYKCILNLFM